MMRLIIRSLLILASLSSLAVFAQPDSAPFPAPPNIKGLQVQMTDDALKLGLHHAAINVSLGALMDLEMKPDNPRWTCEGQEYSFNAGYLRSLDAQIKPLSDTGIVIYAILLAYPSKQPDKDSILVHPKARKDYKYNIAAFNTATPEGVRWFRAVTEFLAARWNGTGSGRVWGWIVGNEVNSHWMWYNLGECPLEEAASEHEKAMRIVHESARKAAANARVYLSLDHHWSIGMHSISAKEAVPGRDFLDTFARIARERGDFDWNIAHHPYPEDLGNPRVWADKSVTSDDSTPKVTFKNLEVLARHLQEPGLLFKGSPRRIILSEQGFQTPLTPDGEQLQAAAYAYAWEKCRRIPLIDAFIYHRHVDHAQEGGLRLGLWRNAPGSIADPHSKKLLYDLFIKAGTPAWPNASQFALPITGLQSWDELTSP